jgi:hypothetical protein
LNDAVTAFSIYILPVLIQSGIKLPIVEPSATFMKEIIPNIDHRQITSLTLNAVDLRSTMELAPSFIFNSVKSLTLIGFKRAKDLNDFKTHCPELDRLLLRYINEVDFHNLCKIFNQIQIPLKRFEVYCVYVLCSHRRADLIFKQINTLNSTVESFLLNVQTLTIASDMCYQNYDTCFLRTTTDFLKTMLNIQDVHFVIKKGNVGKLLDVQDWKSLGICHNLKKVTLEVIEKKSHDTHLEQKILQTQEELLNIQQPIQLDVLCN